MTDFNNNIGLFLNIHGAKKVITTMNKLKAGMITTDKANSNLFGDSNIKNYDKARKRLNKLAEQQKLSTDILKKQEKEGAVRASRINKDLALAEAKKNKRREQRLKRLKSKGEFQARQQKFARKEVSNIDDFTNSLKNSSGTLKAATKDSKRFKMEFLGIMFAGMALDKAMTSLFKGMLKNYKEFTNGASTPLSDSITTLNANWKFLKFTLMDVMSGLLKGGLDWVSSFVRSMSSWNPNVLKAVGGGLLTVAAAAKLFFVGGQVALGLNAFSIWSKNLKSKNVKTAADNVGLLSTKVGGMSAGKWALGGTLALAATITTFQVLTDNKTSPIMHGVNIATLAAMGAWIGSAIFPGIGTAIGAIIGAAVGVVITVNDIKVEKKNKEAFERARREFQTSINKDAEKGIEISSLDVIRAYSNALESTGDVKFQKKWAGYYQEQKEQLSLGVISPEEFRSSLAAGLGGKIPEIVGTTVGESMLEGIDDTLTPGMEQIFTTAAEKGTEFITVDMKDAVHDFLTDETKGMAAWQTAADNINATLSETINKTVNIKTVSTNSYFDTPNEGSSNDSNENTLIGG